MGDHSLLKRIRYGELENLGKYGPEGRRKMDGLRGRGSSCVCHHGGLEHRRIRPWGLVHHSMRKGLKVYDRVGERRGKSVRTPAEEKRGRRA